MRAQGADGAGDVAEAALRPGGSIVVWLEPTRMSATRADADALQRRLDALHQVVEGVASGAPGDEHGVGSRRPR